MVVFQDAKLAAYAFATKLTDTNDFLWKVMLRTFQKPIHCNKIYKTANHSIILNHIFKKTVNIILIFTILLVKSCLCDKKLL